MSYTAEFSYTTNHYIDLDSDTPAEALEFILDKTYGDAPHYEPDRKFLEETLQGNSVGDPCDDVSVEVKILKWPHDGDCEPILMAHHNSASIMQGTRYFNVVLTHEDVDLVLQVLSEKLGKREDIEYLPYISESEFYKVKHHTKGHDETDKLKISYNRIKGAKLSNTIHYEPEEQKFHKYMNDLYETQDI